MKKLTKKVLRKRAQHHWDRTNELCTLVMEFEGLRRELRRPEIEALGIGLENRFKHLVDQLQVAVYGKDGTEGVYPYSVDNALTHGVDPGWLPHEWSRMVPTFKRGAN